MYINGEETSFDRTSTYSTSQSFYSSSREWELGRLKDSSDGSTFNNFSGYLDDLAIWNTELSSSEVSQLYNDGSMLTANNISISNLKAYYNFEGSGATLLDQSGNGKNGTIVNADFSTDIVGSSAEGNELYTSEDTSFYLDLSSYSSDVDGDDLTYSIDSDPSNGTATISGSTATYSPDANWHGTDSFQWYASDGAATSSTGTIQIIVSAVQDAPTTDDDTASTDEDNPVKISITASDVDGDDVTFSIVSDVSNGTTSLYVDETDSIVTYTPDDDWNGTDTFTYKANDGEDDSNTSTITITVAAVNDAPTTTDYSVGDATEDTDYSIDVFDTDNSATGTKIVPNNDVEGDTITISIVSQPSNGTASVSGQTITYSPDANYNGTDSLTYKANDGTDDSNTSTITYTIASVEDTPTTEDVSASVNEDSSVDITLDGSDGDSGDTLTYSILIDASNGTTSLSGSTVTYTPDACLLYTSPSPRDLSTSRMPSSA